MTTRSTAVLSLALAAACASSPAATPSTSRGAGAVVGATALMHDSGGRTLGTLVLTDAAEGIAISGRLTGLTPGQHAIHVHTVGRCDPPAFTTAGGHWNPFGREHGLLNPRGSHAGDLPTITVGADGSATVQATTRGGSLRGANALLDADGAAVMIHAAPDDDRTDPAGNAGARIACGVIVAP